jgi:ribosomal protein S6
MRNYQLVLILRPTLSEVEQKKVLTDVKALLKDTKFIKEENQGKKQLAYTIKRETSGIYFNFLLEAKDNFPVAFEKKLVANDSILRYLLLKTN